MSQFQIRHCAIILQIKTAAERFRLPDAYIHIQLSDGTFEHEKMQFGILGLILPHILWMMGHMRLPLFSTLTSPFPHGKSTFSQEKIIILMRNFLIYMMIRWSLGHGNSIEMNSSGVVAMFTTQEKMMDLMLKILMALIYNSCSLKTKRGAQQSWTTVTKNTLTISRWFLTPRLSNISCYVAQISSLSSSTGSSGGVEVLSLGFIMSPFLTSSGKILV